LSEAAKPVPRESCVGIPEIVGFITRGLTSVGVPPEDAGQVVHAEELAVHIEEVGPLVRPVFDKRLAADELVDEFVALDLGVAFVVEERSGCGLLRTPLAIYQLHSSKVS